MEKVLLYDLESLTDKNSKDWQYHFDLIKGNLTDYISKNKDTIADLNDDLYYVRQLLTETKDKISRRNMQIKDLKEGFCKHKSLCEKATIV